MAVLVMPLNVQTPVVVVPLIPMAMEFAVVVLPIVFDEMVKPPVPAVLMPLKVYPMANVPPVLIAPIVLF